MKFLKNESIRKSVGSLILFSQVFSLLAPLATFAAPQSSQGSDIQNALETVGTKANRLKTVGSSGVDESTGAFTYTYPFSLPKGLMGLEPSIVLSYNSQATENSTVGYGWNLAIPYIERSAKYGVDRIYTKNDFVSSLGGELTQKSGTTNQYIQKIDDGSYQLYTLNNNIFTLTDRSGNIYTYGTTVDSRLSDSTGTKIQKYYLTEVRDILGNKIKYFYEKKNNFVYPKEIIYTIKKDGTYSNKIVFEREDRLDKEVSFKSGFRTEMTDRIKAIRAYTDNAEVAKLELTYALGQNGTRSLLSNIKESRVGTDGLWSTIPDTKFDYSKGTNLTFQTGTPLQAGNTMMDITGDAKPENVSLTEGLSNGINWTFLDYDGNYFIDKYYFIAGGSAYGSPTVNTGVIKRNDNGNFVDLSLSAVNLPSTGAFNIYSQPIMSEMNVLDINADGLQDFLSGTPIMNFGGTFFNASSSAPTGILATDDFNGDGLVDIVKDYASSTNASSSGKYVFLNNGNGWNTLPEFNLKIPFEIKIKNNYGTELDGGFRVVDINCDGLADIIKSWQSNQVIASGELVQMSGPTCYGYCAPAIVNPGSESLAYLNDGKGFVKLENVNFGGNFAISYDKGYVSSGWNPFWTRQVLTMPFYDSNGDGSVDFGGGLSSFKRQDILKQVTTALGAKSEIFYTGSVNQNNPKLPINILTVSEIKNTEVNKNLIDSTKYTYSNGKMYYDKNNIYDRRFAGFQKVTTETNTGTGATPNVKRVVKYFHQGDGDDATTYERDDSFNNIGRVYREEVYGVTNNVSTKYAETYRTYGVYNWDGQIYKYPKLEVSTEFDKLGNKFSKATQFDYDLAARLPKQTENWGEVKWDITTGTFADVGDDYVLTKNIYNTKRPQKLLAEESQDINGKFLDKKLYFYDELPFGYVEKGLLSEERNYSNANNYVKTNYTYNANGMVATKTENNGAVTSYSYDANFNPITVINALGQANNATYNKSTGLKITETNANGKIVNTVYDGFANVKSISATSPKDDTVKLIATKSISYNFNGMTEVENIYNAGTIYKTSTKNYDSFGRLIKSQNNNTENSNQTIDVTYNNLGQMTTVSYPYDNNGILAGYFAGNNTTYSYDELGRNVSVTQGDLTNYTDYLVNGKGTRDNTIDQHKKEYKYNSLGKLVNVKEYTSSTGYTETKYEWNLLGGLTKLTDAMGNVRNFSYDSEGRLLKQEDLHSISDNTFGTYSYIYDTNGLLTSKKDPSNNVATYEYDLLNRPKKESLGLVTNYTYDICQNGIGSLCEVNNSEYSQTLKYNKVGNTVSEIKIINGENSSSTKSFENKYEYNDLGQNTKIVLPDNSYIAYSYDVNGKQKTASVTRMINVNGSVVASTTNVVTDAKYNIDGTIKNITSGNNVKTCYEYSNGSTGSPQAGGNVLPRLSKINVTSASDCNSVTTNNLLFGQELKYNLFGSIIENKETFGPNNFNSGISNEVNNKYTYDVLQRLTKSERLENNLTVVNNLAYNSIGNILSSDSTNYSYSGADYQNPHAPSVIGNTSMSYDLNGNVLGDNKNKYEWNIKNTLKKVANDKSVTEYTYDVSGERIKEISKIKTNTSTFAVNSEINNLLGSSTAQELVKDLPYISEDSYNELNGNKLAKQNKVEALFAIALEASKYVKDTCKLPINIADTNCQKKESVKFVASYLYLKHNIKLSAKTLEEMYQIYIGNLRLSNSVDVYAKKDIGMLATTGRTCNLYQSESNCPMGINLATTTGKLYEAVFKYGVGGWFGEIVPIEIYINGEKVMSSKLVTTQETININPYIKKATTTNLLNNFNVEMRGIFGGWSGMLATGLIEVKEVAYLNTNINQIINPIVTDSVLNEKVYGAFEVQDKNLLGAIYKQKKIASLFGSDRLISKESFTEISTLPFTYSDLIIKDMLIDASFLPYGTCDQYAVDEVERKCRKEIFVKYIFAIIKYETDRELSPITLDELAEVAEGNLSIPNNADEYYLYDVKKIASPNYINETLIYTQQYYPSIGTIGGCNVGYYIGSYYGSGMTSYSSCKPVFSLPQEVKDRANDIFKVEIENLNIPKSLTDLKVYLNVGNPTYTTTYPAVSDFAKGVNESLSLTIPNYIENSNLTVDIVGIIKPLAKGEVTGNGLRFTSNVSGVNPPSGQSNFSALDQLGFPVSGLSTLKYTFRKDAPQNESKYYTPLVINPKDAATYVHVLQVLARIDKDYKAGPNTIISGEAFSEIKNTYATSTEKLIKLFEENEKLQKDDTLAAVWQKVKTDYNQELTREALEELYLVWTGVTALPVEADQYNWRLATTTQVLASVGTTTVKSYVKILSTTPVTLNSINYLNISVEPNFSVFERKTLSNLSVVPNVFSLRTLSDTDIINTKMYVSTSSKAALKLAGIEKREDVLQFTTTIPNFVSNSTTTIKRENKIDNLTKINSEIKRIKNVSLSRESLEEIYYILNNKLVINNLDLATGPQEISGLIVKNKMNGQVGTSEKRKDEQRADKNIFVESAVTAVNGRGDTTGLGAYQFNGGYIKFPNTVPVITNNAQTYSIWYKGIGGQSLFNTTSKGTRNFLAVWFSNGVLVPEIGWTNNSGYVAAVGQKQVTDNVWHKIDIVVENNPSANVKVFIDGVLDVDSKDQPHKSGNAMNLSNISNEFIIGATENYLSGQMQAGMSGAVDEFKIYNKALTSAEITTAYNNDIGNYTVVQENLDVFSKSTFKLLEPIPGVTSEYVLTQIENIIYNILSPEIKNVSKETVGELRLVNITTKQGILDIFNLTKTTTKDSKLSFFNEYFQVNNNYTFSREALEEIYLVYTDKMTFSTTTTSDNESNYGELRDVSTEKRLDTTYTNELNSSTFNLGTTTATTSTSTIVRVTSPIAFAEMTAIAATTTLQIKNLFSTASSSLGKDAKLYHVYKTIKDTKNIELTRLTLEEMWNINIDRQLPNLGSLSTTTTTTITPTPLASNAYYKMDGSLATNGKKQDEILNSRLITENSATTNTGRKNDTNGSYALTGAGVNKIVTITPTPITNNPMTYSLWMKGNNATAYQRIISMNTDASRTFIDLNVYSGKPYFEIGNAGVVNIEGAGVANIANNQWHKLDLVITNNPTTLKLYVNGELDRTLTSATPFNLSGLDNKINLGCYGTGNTCVSPFTGSLDDFKIFTKALTSEEVRREYQIDTNSLPPVITTNTTISQDVFNRDRYQELTLISPISQLKYAYDVQTGLIIEPPLDESIKNPPTPSTGSGQAIATLNSTSTPVTNPNAINISTTTLALLNPLNLGYVPKSTSEIELQINGVSYIVNLQNYIQFYIDLNANNINTLAKYLNKLQANTEQISYTKFYPSAYYEYDSRGVVTINIPFNGKVVGTYKYQGELSEVSYIHNSYNSTPVLQTDSTGSTTAVIKRDVWGDMLSNNYNSNEIIPTSYGLTGHKWDDNAGITYSHARYLSNKNKVWLSEDPMAITGFSTDYFIMNPQFQNSYSYGGNNPVNNVDPDGKRVYVWPGTFHGEAGWNPMCDAQGIYQRVEKTFGEKPTRVQWSGENTPQARTEAVNWILNDLKANPLKPGESLDVVAHSHGSNGVKEFSIVTPVKIRNAILLATPLRDDYQMNMDNVENYVNVYSYFDLTGGWLGGNGITIRAVNSTPGPLYGTLTGPITNDGLGGGFRDSKATKNVSVTGSTFTSLFPNFWAGPHGAVWSNGDIWSNYVAPVVKLPEQKKK